MANVTTYLDKLMSAIYGKDVRQSIYDSIKAINTQVEAYSSAESNRVSAEASRAGSERVRVTNENSRKSAESERVQAEDERIDAEEMRQSNYDALASATEQLLKDLQKMAKGQVTFLNIYPVGSIYFSVNNVNPGTLFGGTWVAWGSGRVPVGVNTSDSDFSIGEKTGGSKYLQNHTHTFTGTSVIATGGAHSHMLGEGVVAMPSDNDGGEIGAIDGTASLDVQVNLLADTDSGSHSHTFTAKGTNSNTGSGNSQNLQPYITCYMWKRTA